MAGGSPDAQLRFAVERTLGRLARWLRILGHDATYTRQLEGRALLRCGRQDRRVVLTRDRRLAREAAPPERILVTSDHFREQLRQLAGEFPIMGGDHFSRCVECNRPLEAVTAETVRALVPAYVRQTQSSFRRCPGCRRVYWPATHQQHVEQELAALGLGEGAQA